MDERFNDNGEFIFDFMDEILVNCPKCQGCANGFFSLAEPAKIICQKCGLYKIYDMYSYGNGNFCGEELWLKIHCCSNYLWAYNKKHLEFIEQYIKANIRQRKPNVNQSIVSRLPQWMKKASNREKILRCDDLLKQRLELK